jgi:hypothetical protein
MGCQGEKGAGPRGGGEGEQAGLRDGLGWVELPFSFLSFSSFLYSNYSNTTI